MGLPRGDAWVASPEADKRDVRVIGSRAKDNQITPPLSGQSRTAAKRRFRSIDVRSLLAISRPVGPSFERSNQNPHPGLGDDQSPLASREAITIARTDVHRRAGRVSTEAPLAIDHLPDLRVRALPAERRTGLDDDEFARLVIDLHVLALPPASPEPHGPDDLAHSHLQC